MWRNKQVGAKGSFLIHERFCSSNIINNALFSNKYFFKGVIQTSKGTSTFTMDG